MSGLAVRREAAGPGGIDLQRLEEAGLNGAATPRQVLYDGWLLRLAPGKAKRARSVNAHFPSTLPLAHKIAFCERLYATHGLPLLFRITPFVQPPDLEAELERRGYLAFDPTLAQAAALDRPPGIPESDAELGSPEVYDFVEAVGTMRGSSPEARAGHLERLRHAALPTGRVLALFDGQPVACGQWLLHDGIAGIYDVITRAAFRGHGFATLVTARLLEQAWERGARVALLQVDEANAPALAVYRKFGFATVYTYYYRGRPGACE